MHTIHIFMAMTATWLVPRASFDALVVDTEAPKTPFAFLLERSTESERQSMISKAGYFEKSTGTAFILFSEATWQQKAMDQVMSQYKALRQAIRPGGLVDLQSNSEMRELASSMVPFDGFDIGPSTTAVVIPERKLTLSTPSKSIQLVLPAMLSDTQSEKMTGGLEQNLSSARTPASNTKYARVIWPDHFSIAGTGKLQSDRVLQYRVFQKAISEISDHFDSFEKRRLAAYNALLLKATGVNFKDNIGKAVNDLSADLKDSIARRLRGNYSTYGFHGMDEVSSFLARATLSNSRSTLMLTFVLNPNDRIKNTVQMALY